MLNAAAFGGMTLFAISGWLLYLREMERSRDYATDLIQIVHDHPEAKQSLRRATNWDEIARWVENE